MSQETNVRPVLNFTQMGYAEFKAIMGKPLPVIGLGNDGQTISAVIKGATHGYYDEKNDQLKDIYNFDILKQEYRTSDDFATALAEAREFEAAGKAKEAHEAYNAIARNSKLSYSVINRDGMKQQFQAGDAVRLTLGVVESKEGRKSIGVIAMSLAPVTTVARRTFHLPE